ncbi:MAG: GNAT family N-acetyltransferase [Bacteroidales bacterium]|nr:GNAT family N-acetyltransferase [Bacteroidales bacterium]
MDTSYVIPPIEKEILLEELKKAEFLRKTNSGNREIYITNAHITPNIMREIGRLRELSFGAEGGGSGKDCDIDEYDVLEYPHYYTQLFVWDQNENEIVGGYRYISGKDILEKDGIMYSATAGLFHFTPLFKSKYLNYTLELGRSFVSPQYQPSVNLRKGMFSLDNLWDGLGALAKNNPEIKYFFGKITMYPSMDVKARDYIQYFFKKHFPDNEGMIYPIEPVEIITDYNELAKLFNGLNYKEDHQILIKAVKERNEFIPPLFNAYMNLSSTMKTFGTAINKHFSNVEETGILVTIADIYPEKQNRYMNY